MEKKEYGVIQEQGDLGLGFTPIKEQTNLEKAINTAKEKDEDQRKNK